MNDSLWLVRDKLTGTITVFETIIPAAWLVFFQPVKKRDSHLIPSLKMEEPANLIRQSASYRYSAECMDGLMRSTMAKDSDAYIEYHVCIGKCFV